MENLVLVLNKVVKLIAPYKATESKTVVLAAAVDVLAEMGFDANQCLVIAIKAYEIA